MQIHYRRNIHFTRLLKADGRQREFNFRKITPESGEAVFSVDVSDDRGNRLIFRMSKQGSEWKIDPQALPAWIIDNESAFHRIIEEEYGSGA